MVATTTYYYCDAALDNDVAADVASNDLAFLFSARFNIARNGMLYAVIRFDHTGTVISSIGTFRVTASAPET